jgi:hypothetical protein
MVNRETVPIAIGMKRERASAMAVLPSLFHFSVFNSSF